MLDRLLELTRPIDVRVITTRDALHESETPPRRHVEQAQDIHPHLEVRLTEEPVRACLALDDERVYFDDDDAPEQAPSPGTTSEDEQSADVASAIMTLALIEDLWKKSDPLSSTSLEEFLSGSSDAPDASKSDASRDVRDASNPNDSGRPRSRRDEYLAQATVRLDRINAQIDSLDRRLRSLEHGPAAKADETLARLREERDMVASAVKEFIDSPGETWKSLEEGLELAWSRLEKAARAAASTFR
jgi:hypothetical protein